MLITAIVHQYPPLHNAGAEWYLHSVLRWLTRRGHQAQVYVTRGRSTTFQGVEVKILRSTSQRIDGDVLVTHLDLTRQAMQIARNRRKPLVHLIHNDAQLRFHQVTMEHAQLVVFNSHWIERKNGWRGAHVVVHPPVFVDDYATCGRNDRVTMINLSRAKGAEIFWALADAEPERRFLGVRGAYGEQVVPEAMPSNVEVMSQTSDVRGVYASTRVLLMPSSYESFGRVAIEAACSGIPTIASPTPGLREALNGAGIFVDSHPTFTLDDNPIAARNVPEQGPVEAWQEKLRYLDDPASYHQASLVARGRALQLASKTEDQLIRLEKTLADL